MGEELSRSGTRVIGFDDPELDFQLLRQLGAASYGGASVGEALAAAARIRERSPGHWTDEFAELADRQFADAKSRAQAGHQVSAREIYLLAANSYRAAEYFSPVGTERHNQLGLASREAFLAAMRLCDYVFEPLEISVDGHVLPGYWITPAAAAGHVGPTLVATSGFDGTLEETFFQVGRSALERGWRVLLIAGLGQADTVRTQPDAAFVPDTERWISPWLDVALARPETDPSRTALLGISFGGYFVLRAAAADNRIQAVVANSPIVDLHAYMCSFAGMDPAAPMSEEENFTIDEIDSISDTEMPPQLKEMTRNLMRRFGQRSWNETFAYLKRFTVEPARVVCPALALVGEGEGAEPQAQCDRFVSHAGGKVSQRVFTRAEGADTHCQLGNLVLSNAVTFDWLEEIFG